MLKDKVEWMLPATEDTLEGVDCEVHAHLIGWTTAAEIFLVPFVAEDLTALTESRIFAMAVENGRWVL